MLPRVANGDGSVEREQVIGRGCMDLRLRRGPGRLAIAVKTWRDREGLGQLDAYLAGLGLDTDSLVVFGAEC